MLRSLFFFLVLTVSRHQRIWNYSLQPIPCFTGQRYCTSSFDEAVPVFLFKSLLCAEAIVTFNLSQQQIAHKFRKPIELKSRYLPCLTSQSQCKGCRRTYFVPPRHILSSLPLASRSTTRTNSSCHRFYRKLHRHANTAFQRTSLNWQQCGEIEAAIAGLGKTRCMSDKCRENFWQFWLSHPPRTCLRSFKKALLGSSIIRLYSLTENIERIINGSEIAYPFKSIERYSQDLWKQANVFHTDATAYRNYYIARLNHSSSEVGTERSPKRECTVPPPPPPPFYMLLMFPYPSGSGLHLGHIYTYVLGDIIYRYKYMCGYNAFMPMGWDSFGLPAEQHVIKSMNEIVDKQRSNAEDTSGTKSEMYIDIEEHVRENIDRFRSDINKFGLGVDWSKELSTSHSKYYKYTQLLFNILANYDYYRYYYDKCRNTTDRYLGGDILRRDNCSLALHDELLESSLYKREYSYVNWCPDLHTVLADEEVDSNGKSVRGGFAVYSLLSLQWAMDVQKYSELLLETINGTDNQYDWPESVKNSQTNWIGPMNAYAYTFDVQAAQSDIQTNSARKSVMTFEVLSLFNSSDGTSGNSTALINDGEFILASTNNDYVKTLYHIIANTNFNVTTEAIRDAGIPSGYSILRGLEASDRETGRRLPIILSDASICPWIRYFGENKRNRNNPNFKQHVSGSSIAGSEDCAVVSDDSTTRVRNSTTCGRNSSNNSSAECSCTECINLCNRMADRYKIRLGVPRLCNNDKELFKVLSKYLPTGSLASKNKVDVNIPHNAILWKAKRIYKLRDWIYSRQRYWGEPFPVLYNYNNSSPAKPRCMSYILAIPPDKLPLRIPRITTDINGDKEVRMAAGIVTNSPLANIPEWRAPLNTTDILASMLVTHSNDKKKRPSAVPLFFSEDSLQNWMPYLTRNRTVNKVSINDLKNVSWYDNDVMPSWAGSNWYYLAYLNHHWIYNTGTSHGSTPENERDIFDYDSINYWLPVSLYIGGSEHDTGHLLYTRLFYKALKYKKLLGMNVLPDCSSNTTNGCSSTSLYEEWYNRYNTGKAPATTFPAPPAAPDEPFKKLIFSGRVLAPNKWFAFFYNNSNVSCTAGSPANMCDTNYGNVVFLNSGEVNTHSDIFHKTNTYIYNTTSESCPHRIVLNVGTCKHDSGKPVNMVEVDERNVLTGSNGHYLAKKSEVTLSTQPLAASAAPSNITTYQADESSTDGIDEAVSLYFHKGSKLSKSLSNYVAPRIYAERYSVDVVRAYLLYAGPLHKDKVLNFNNNPVVTYINKSLNRLWEMIVAGRTHVGVTSSNKIELRHYQLSQNILYESNCNNNGSSSPYLYNNWYVDNVLRDTINCLIKDVNRDMVRYHLHKPINQILSVINQVFQYRKGNVINRRSVVGTKHKKKLPSVSAVNNKDISKGIPVGIIVILLKLLHPYCPHITEFLWRLMRANSCAKSAGGGQLIPPLLLASWPKQTLTAHDLYRAETLFNDNYYFRNSKQ